MHTLYIVATPIGNMEDITYRAVRILKEVPLVLAEDTRHTRILFDNYGISTPMEAYHDFNKEKVTPKYVEFLKNEGDIALVSDAGTPGVMPTDHFTFQYFSPKKSAQRIHLLEKLKDEEATQIFYASPHNIDKFVEEIGQVFGEIKIALMRELTKKFEEHLIGTPAEITAHFKAHPPKGEFVLIFNPKDKSGL